MVASDRLSAFDVVMAEPVPDKGRVLTAMSAFWFELLRDVAPNHLISTELSSLPGAVPEAGLAGRMMLVRRCDMLPVECIVRGYLAGSGWQEYRATGRVCGLRLPAGLRRGRPPAGADVHAVDQGGARAARREHHVRRGGGDGGRRGGRRGACPRARRLRASRGPRRGARDHRRRHQVRARAGSTATSSWPTRCSRLTRRASGPPIGGSPGPRHPASTSSPCATSWPPADGTVARLRHRCRPQTIAATRARYVEAYERLSGRSFDDWPGSSPELAGR